MTTGAQNDLEKVTKMAYAQIQQFGFSEAVGLVSFESDGGVKPYSKRLAATMDLEARRMVGEAYRRTEEVLGAHREQLQQLAELLLVKETLNYADVEALLGPPPFRRKAVVLPEDYEAGLAREAALGQGRAQGVGGSSG